MAMNRRITLGRAVGSAATSTISAVESAAIGIDIAAQTFAATAHIALDEVNAFSEDRAINRAAARAAKAVQAKTSAKAELLRVTKEAKEVEAGFTQEELDEVEALIAEAEIKYGPSKL